jgi:hypothetical protein
MMYYYPSGVKNRLGLVKLGLPYATEPILRVLVFLRTSSCSGCADFRASPRPLHQTSFRLAEASYAVAIFWDVMAPRTFLADVISPKVQPVTHCNCDMTDLLPLLSQIFSKPRDSVQALVGWRLFRSAVLHLDTVSPT